MSVSTYRVGTFLCGQWELRSPGYAYGADAHDLSVSSVVAVRLGHSTPTRCSVVLLLVLRSWSVQCTVESMVSLCRSGQRWLHRLLVRPVACVL